MAGVADATAHREEGSHDAGENRRRGRGRDRNRRERHLESDSDTAEVSATSSQSLSQADAQAIEAVHQAGSAVPAPLEAQVPSHAAEAPPVTSAAMTEPVAARVTEPEAVPAVVPQTLSTLATVPAPVVVAAQGAAAAPFVLPMDSLQAVAEAAGLQWVSSDADKIRAVQADMAREPKPAHVPRERKPVQNVDEGPLVLVETRKDLSQFKLPFDVAQAAASGQTPPQV